MRERDLRLLLFNLATDADDPVLGFTTGWIRALAQRVAFIDVITMRLGRVEVPGNVRVFSVGKERGYSEPRRVLEFYRYLTRLLASKRYDACFSHMIPVFTMMGAPFLKRRGIPMVTWYAHRHVTQTLKIAYRFSDRVVTSAPTAFGYKNEKLEVLGQGIDTDLFTSSPGLKPSMPSLVLSVGRLSPMKDLGTLIRALHLLDQRGYKVKCALVGEALRHDRAYAADIRRLASDLALKDVVQFVGPIPNERTVDWYQSCLVHVNLCPTGALDKAAIEAMSCAKPSLVANAGFRETMGIWANRLIFEHGNPESLADRLTALLKMSPEELREMGDDLRRSVLANHSLAGLADHLVGMLTELASDQAALV